MADLFIPPEGAMQFEVLRDWNGDPVPEGWAPYLLWVIPDEGIVRESSMKPDCPHIDNRYIAVWRTTPKSGFTGELPTPVGWKFAVCECVGRIIE